MKRQNHQSPVDAISALIIGTCKYPDECRITIHSGAIRVLPHMADYPILVGSEGRQVNALKYVALKAGFEISLEESFIGEREPKQPFAYNREADQIAMLDLIRDLCAFTFEQPPRITSDLKVDDSVQGQTMTVRIEPVADDANAHQIISALAALIHPYSFRQGLMIRIRPGKSNNQTIKA